MENRFTEGPRSGKNVDFENFAGMEGMERMEGLVVGGKSIEWSKNLEPNHIMNLNHKLRSDSVFTQLTPEQIEQLEDWLFEEKLGYKEVREKLEKEFGVKTSQTALGRFFRRLADERSRELRAEAVAQCLEALATAKDDGTLQAGLFALAGMQAARLLTEEKPTAREFTALLRSLTSAQAQEFKREESQRAKDERKARLVKEAKEQERSARMAEENQAYWEAREQKRKATLAAKKAAAEKAGGTLSGAAEPGHLEIKEVMTLKAEEMATSPQPSPPEAERVTDCAVEPIEPASVEEVIEQSEAEVSNRRLEFDEPTEGERNGDFFINRAGNAP